VDEPQRSRAGRRLLLVVVAVALGAVAWGSTTAAEAALAGGQVIDLGPLQLRLTHNSGVAFSIGAGLPTGVVVGFTALVTLGVAAYTWAVAPEASAVRLTGLAAVIAGATTNVLDRAVDGHVSDYFHTGWFATFNVSDSLITIGVVLVVITVLLARPSEQETTM
jgi:signal peptidase II